MNMDTNYTKAPMLSDLAQGNLTQPPALSEFRLVRELGSGHGARHQEGRHLLHDAHGGLQPHANAHLGASPSGDGAMRGRGLELTSIQVEMGLKWVDSASGATRIVDKRFYTSAAGLHALSIAAACYRGAL